MGAVKEFALWLSERIYISHWSDEEIISSLTNQYPDTTQPHSSVWLHEQIYIVKENPTLFQSMLEANKEEKCLRNSMSR